MSEEIWVKVPIKKYEDYYLVSNLGRVKSVSRMIGAKNGSLARKQPRYLKQNIKRGYASVTLCDNSERKCFLVHRLVGMAFISNPNNLPFINHKDCNKLNNSVRNLEWCTRSENAIHAYQNGRIPWIQKQQQDCKGETSAAAKIVVDLSTGVFFESAAIAAKCYGIKATTLVGYLNGSYRNKTSLRYA